MAPHSKGARSTLAWPLGLALAASLLALVFLSIVYGPTGRRDPAACMRGILAAFGAALPLPGKDQAIVELRLWRTLLGCGVGSALALSGALLQGVFRNSLAAPSILGISAGAALGASLAILALGGHGPLNLYQEMLSGGPWFVAAAAFLGALVAALLVVGIASVGGRFSVPSLLLGGIAINACFGGILAAVQAQAISLEDNEVARAVVSWGFGSLDDKGPGHVLLVWSGVALVLLVYPFVSRELDLFAGGEDDARSLGVNTLRTKILAISAASLSAAIAVAVAGQIAFVGLVVPHALRLISGRSHRSLLPLCFLGGAVFLSGTELLQVLTLGGAALRPGVLMSLIGGPFLVVLLFAKRRELSTW